jgi:hypothetical protein
MNSPLVMEHATRFAGRLLAETKTSPERIERAFLLCYGRPPTAAEQAEAVDFVARFAEQSAGKHDPACEAWAVYCQALYSSAEFRFLR